MSDIISLDAAREHLRLGSDVDEQLLAPLIAAAEEAVAGELGRATLVGQGGWPDADSVPQAVVHAIKLVLGHLFEFRETTIAGTTATELTIGGQTTLRMLLQRHVVVSFA